MVCVILAGGDGLRLWPLSRKHYPKQFLSFSEPYTLFQGTVLRNQSLCSSFLVVTGVASRPLIERQLADIGVHNYRLLLETVGRNTAPAITLAAMSLSRQENDTLFVVPSDARIEDEEAYAVSVREAEQMASAGYLVTFGIRPTCPHTGYGYIRHKGCDVLSFKEKPDSETAQRYLEDGSYLWNSGMFLFRTDTFLNEIKKYRNDIFIGCLELFQNINETEAVILDREHMERIPSESVDYAVMEKSDTIKVIPSNFRWVDIGGLEALCDTIPTDGESNRSAGGNAVFHQSQGVSVINQKSGLVVVNGLQNVIVVNTPDAVYLSKRGDSAQIKQIISDHPEYRRFFEQNGTKYFAWGYEEEFARTEGYGVVRKTISPNGKTDPRTCLGQRAYLTVVSGSAAILTAGGGKVCEAGESVSIRQGGSYWIENRGKKNAVLLETEIEF